MWWPGSSRWNLDILVTWCGGDDDVDDGGGGGGDDNIDDDDDYKDVDFIIMARVW